MTYPDDKEPKKETFGPGSWLDVDARRRHEVWLVAYLDAEIAPISLTISQDG